MKVYKSSSLAASFMGTRAQAAEMAREHVRDANLVGRFTWRADDDSGFTIQSAAGRVFVANKWNASRQR